MIDSNLISILLFILGSAFGSFLSVLVYRLLHNQKGILWGHSRCPQCKHRLKPWDLIPIISWLIKGGRCSYCKKNISAIYPSLELVTGLLFVTNYNLIISGENFQFFNNYQTDWLLIVKMVFLCLISLNLVAIFFSDLQKKTIPNLLLYTWIGLTAFAFLLTGNNFIDELINRAIALGIGLVFFGGQYLVSKGKWLGSGDIYVAAGMALLLGVNNFLVAVAFSYIIGCLISLPLLIFKKLKFKETIAFAPFLILGTLLALYHGNNFLNWYLGDLISLIK
jgi:prepilin signal peptidase PulO-like enzyme (type II secretory pathway)